MDWNECTALANSSMDFVECDRLDRAVRALSPDVQAAARIKVALLSSCTATHLHAGIRVAGLRRGFLVETYECGWGQQQQELLDKTSALHSFAPDVVLLSIDAHSVTTGTNDLTSAEEANASARAIVEGMRRSWALAREAFSCHVIQQAVMPIMEPVLGENEHRLPSSSAAFIECVNALLRGEADAAGVDVIAVDSALRRDGVEQWYSPAIWHKAKQEIAHPATPLFGDLVMRLVAARRGKSFKCLVMDLDNTLWGGVIGDDGLNGIVVGQGSAAGEAFLSVQAYARQLSKRGVILAVCSKNTEEVAREVFEKHPEMLLRSPDISCFVANWRDKASNIRSIAQRLNIGLDSLVFLDDNPFERNLVREELPEVAVPELPEDPALFARTLAASGYFEAVAITAEDRSRAMLYRSNAERQALANQATDLAGYLKSLDMKLQWGRFDEANRQRVVQLINKTNQFNLTTRRYTDDEYSAVMCDSQSFGLHFRLLDRFGDNGIISVVIGRKQEDASVLIDTWLMSCRVLGREVEHAVLAVVVAAARELGADRLVGEYRRTDRNAMVAKHYEKLGFELMSPNPEGASFSQLRLESFKSSQTTIEIAEARDE